MVHPTKCLLRKRDFYLGDSPMKISDRFTQRELLELLIISYIKGQEKDTIHIAEFIEEMKQKVLSVVNSNDHS
jgi:hypothetical protein